MSEEVMMQGYIRHCRLVEVGDEHTLGPQSSSGPSVAEDTPGNCHVIAILRKTDIFVACVGEGAVIDDDMVGASYRETISFWLPHSDMGDDDIVRILNV